MVEGQRRADHVRGNEQAQEQTIIALRDRAREHHPDIEVSDACWRQQVAAALGEHEQPVSIAAADLWLACGCAEGDSLALAAARAQLREGFERIALAKVGRQEELSELFALLRSRLDVSLRMLFRSPSPTEARASSVR